MAKEQFVEGKIAACKGNACAATCCDDDQVEEWANEYFAFHERIKDHILATGTTIEFVSDRVRFRNCSDGKRCKFLIHSLNKDIDPRPIDCKIYPFAVDWNSIDFDQKQVKIYYWDKGCPLVQSNTIPASFRKEVEEILKRDFAVLFYGARFSFEFVDEVLKN